MKMLLWNFQSYYVDSVSWHFWISQQELSRCVVTLTTAQCKPKAVHLTVTAQYIPQTMSKYQVPSATAQT